VIFTWDESKNRSNYRKHGVFFETAVVVFDDPDCVMTRDRIVDDEERWQTIGLVEGVLLLLVAHTLETLQESGDDEEIVRIISARVATARERRRYESGQEE
jgi:hypothetical protein